MAIKEKWNIEKIGKSNNKKVAIVGGGPAGLTATAYLAKRGFQVSIYERHKMLGGLMAYGIPDFRLQRDVIWRTIDKILSLGVEANLGKELGTDFTIEELESKYDAILLAFGANISSKMNIEGEELEGVFGANELLENEGYPDFQGKIVAIIGGGNTAMDIARTVVRKNAKQVMVIYRRARKQMPAEAQEVEEAIKEGVQFLFQNNIVKISGNERVEQIECIKTELVKVEGGREKPVNINDTNYIINVDYVITALGSIPEEKVMRTLNLEKEQYGYIKIDENNRTSIEKVFACGDIAGAKSTVAWAARSGRNAAEEIVKFLNIE